MLAPPLWLIFTSSIRYDSRTRNDRTHLQNQAWAAQLADLAYAYLEFKMGTARGSEGAEGGVSMKVLTISFHGDFFLPPVVSWH